MSTNFLRHIAIGQRKGQKLTTSGLCAKMLSYCGVSCCCSAFDFRFFFCCVSVLPDCGWSGACAEGDILPCPFMFEGGAFWRRVALPFGVPFAGLLAVPLSGPGPFIEPLLLFRRRGFPDVSEPLG